MEILLASHNQHKADEIKTMLPSKYKLLTLNDIGFNEEIEETGDSFEENAWIKTKAAFERAQIPTFSDDSGLCIQSLNGAPGIYSARYAGTGNANDNINKVLKELNGEKNRNAYFISVISFFDGNQKDFFEGRVKGEIIGELKGNQGFGYDPIFIPEGYSQTFAEIPSDIKNKISHRANALNQFLNFLNQY